MRYHEWESAETTDNREQNYKDFHIWGLSDIDYKTAMMAILNEIKGKLKIYSRTRKL